jgi:biotin synthase-related radical SAM superfamily protein
MNKQVQIIIASLILLTACGSNKEELEKAQKAREDSIRSATESATLLKVEMIMKLADSIKKYEAQRQVLEDQLTQLKVELNVAIDKMETIKDIQLLRTPSEREEQIRNQSIVINQIEKEINKIPLQIQGTIMKINEFKSEIKKYE